LIAFSIKGDSGMKQTSLHARQEVRNYYLTRGLAKSFPQLKPYLFPNARVLDVGCGPGSITLDVAREAAPGHVFGIDPVYVSIEQANELKAEQKVANVTFQVGQAQELDFPDDTFDVTYCVRTFRWIADPVRSVAELKRVTRPGGWVVCTLPEQGVRLRYPPCPTFDQVVAIRSKHWTDPTDPDHFCDKYVGRRAVELFRRAGFNKLHIEPDGLEIRYAGEGPVSVEGDLWWLDREGTFGVLYDKLFSLGVLDEEMINAARAELENWAQHPYAFWVYGIDLVVAAQA
jgi:ubiquinone/menaquinone biosynthesis C-methylase UbiE